MANGGATSVVEALLGTLAFICMVFLALVYLTRWRLQLKDYLTGGHEAREFWRGGGTTRHIELTARDRELVANGWHPDDVIAARRNGIALPDKPS